MKPIFQRLYQYGTYILVILVTMSGCIPDQKKETDSNQVASQPAPGYNQFENSKITVQVFKVDSIETNGSRGWGYDIMIDDKLYIHQPNIPAIMGNNGFSSEENAKKAGEFIVNKIRNNVMPPSVSAEELDSLGVIN